MIAEVTANPEPLIAPKQVVTQAPGTSFPDSSPPSVAIAGVGQPVGTTVASKPSGVFWINNGVPPERATLGVNEVPTTSKQDPDNPAPVPVVGTVPPTAVATKIKTVSVAPATQQTKRTIGIVVAVILLGWFFLGWSFREVL